MTLQSRGDSSLCGIVAEEENDFLSRAKEMHFEKLLSTRVIAADIFIPGYSGVLIFEDGVRRHERNLWSFSW